MATITDDCFVILDYLLVKKQIKYYMDTHNWEYILRVAKSYLDIQRSTPFDNRHKIVIRNIKLLSSIIDSCISEIMNPVIGYGEETASKAIDNGTPTDDEVLLQFKNSGIAEDAKKILFDNIYSSPCDAIATYADFINDTDISCWRLLYIIFQNFRLNYRI